MQKLVFYPLAACLAILVLAPIPLSAQSSDYMKNLLRTRIFEGPFQSLEEFEEAIAQAKEVGVEEHLILEAQIILYLRGGMSPEMLELIDQALDWEGEYPYAESRLIQSERDVEGLRLVSDAYRAFERDDRVAFERLAKETFWHTPAVGQLLTAQINEIHEQDLMKELKVPLDTPLALTAGGESSLAELMEGKKAILIDFWATWCGPCIRSMPDLQKRADTLPEQGVAVIALNTDDLEKAEAFRQEHGYEFPWLFEPEERPYSRLLRVTSIPRAVLLAPDGSVLFNGHPYDPELNDILADLGVEG